MHLRVTSQYYLLPRRLSQLHPDLQGHEVVDHVVEEEGEEDVDLLGLEVVGQVVEEEEGEGLDLLDYVQLLLELVLLLEEVDQDHLLLWTDSALYPPCVLHSFFLRTCLPQKLQINLRI